MGAILEAAYYTSQMFLSVRQRERKETVLTDLSRWPELCNEASQRRLRNQVFSFYSLCHRDRQGRRV